MDESLSEFQEVKKSHSGPKTSKTNTKKPRKPLKKPKGQKDIRTALNPKKSDLITYTKKFDTICKESGIDVDTEELQLAIALSKSLQTGTCEGDDCVTEVHSQGRIKKIRTTLQEYGFKVPETKITINNKRRKNKKKYQLLLKSDTEKEQIISDKYSQVLFTNFGELNSSDDLSVSDNPLFYKATNISYKNIKNQNIFYCIELVEQSTSNGCLLRDWAKIPGRPASPKALKDIEMNFSDIECSQEELDVVLSGCSIQTKKILGLKWLQQQNSQKGRSNSKALVSNKDIPSVIIGAEKPIEELTPDKNINHAVIYRSYSPDIFEDEESVIEVIANSAVQETNNDTMDLTECVNNINLKNTFPVKCTISHSLINYKDVTKRKSDDFMEMTDCVDTNNLPQLVQENVDLAQDPEEKEIVMREKQQDKLDLTQSSDSEDDLPEVYLSDKKNLDDTMPLNLSDYKGILSKGLNLCHEVSNDVYDLTREKHFEFNKGNEVIYINDIEILENNKPYISSSFGLTEDPKTTENDINTAQFSNASARTVIVKNNIKVDEVDTLNTSIKTNLINPNNAASRVDDEYITTGNSKFGVFHPSSEKSITDLTPSNYVKTDTEFNKDLPEDNVDLTQSSNSSLVKMDENCSILEESFGNSNDSDNTVILPLSDNCEEITTPQNELKSLDKKDNLSIDYDDLSVINGLNESYKGGNLGIYHINESKGKNKTNDPNYNQGAAFIIDSNSNDSSETVILPLKGNNEEIANLQNERKNLRKKDNISIDYDDLSIINGVNECYTRDNSGIYHINESKGKNKTDNSHSYQDADFIVDKNDNNSNETVILPIKDDIYEEIVSLSHNLDKKDNILINYEDVSISNGAERSHYIGNSPCTSHYKSKHEKRSNSSHSSQGSEFQIIDCELNYSLHKSKRENFNLGGISILDNISNNSSIRKSCNVQAFDIPDNHSPPLVEVSDNENRVNHTPEKNRMNINRNLKTPENDYIIKLDDVTPMPNYAAMSTPERNNELDKYGLKPFKRKRAIQLLTHIYNQTHPIIESMDDLPSPAKRFKSNSTPPSSRRKLSLSQNKTLQILESQDIYEVTNEVPDLKEIQCAVEDWVFQKKEKAKIHSCRVPLHIAFHNYVSCRRRLRESILRYEPIDIDVIHKQLVGYGHRYDPKELLRFMDKKCITVKTTDNSTKNNRY